MTETEGAELSFSEVRRIILDGPSLVVVTDHANDSGEYLMVRLGLSENETTMKQNFQAMLKGVADALENK